MKKKFYIVISVLFLHLAAIASHAATITVTNNNNVGAGSLRQAVIDAASGDTINFAPNITGTITLTAKISFSKSLTISGPGAGILTIAGNNAPTNPGIFEVLGQSGGALNLSNLTLTRSGPAFQGGAVSSTNGAVTLSNCVITGNGGTVADHTQDGGGVYVSGAALNINHCVISNNYATNGGGIRMETGTITDSTISNNFADGDGGGAGIFGTATISNSTFAANSAGFQGGGINANVGFGNSFALLNSTISNNIAAGSVSPTVAPRGAGLMLGFGTMTVTNSTISGNYCGPTLPQTTIARNGGGIYSSESSILNINNSTVTENSALDGGGLYLAWGGGTSLKRLRNTIVAGNFAVSVNSNIPTRDIQGSWISQNYNLIGDGTNRPIFPVSTQPNDQIGTSSSPVNPRLGILANNGGATYTHSLLAGSPAINAGNNAGAPATDQRGVARPQDVVVDIGAYEFGVNPPAFGKIVYESTQDGNREIYSMNADFTNQIRLTNNSAADSAPKWSPDGTKIVFQSRRDGNDEIYTMNADGSLQTRLTFNTPPDVLPDWSPDGSKIVFVKDTSYPSEIWIMDTTGGNQTQLSGGTLFGETEPAWSPDGSRIAFSASPINGGTYELYVMNADGTNPNRLTNNFDTDSYPVWSPDGNSIAYLNDFNGRHAYLINPSNLNIRIVSDINDSAETAPAWSPDGTKLAQYDAAGNLYFTNVGGSARAAAAKTPEGIFISPLSDWFGFNTPTGANISAVSGTTSITFSSVSISGTTVVAPIDPATVGTLPGGYTLGAGFPAYEITTTAIYTAPITVCLQVPSVTNPVTFNALTLFHSEGGMLIDRTISRTFATKTICASVSSLSPFVVAQNLAPSAANVSVSGRVSTAEGYGISRAWVSIINSNGETQTVLTSSFGYFRFDEIPVGETYVISVRAKGFQFDSQVLTVSEDIRNADFTALP